MVGIRRCDLPDCYGRHEAKGWCAKHYQRMKLNGTMLLRPQGMDAAELQGWKELVSIGSRDTAVMAPSVPNEMEDH